MRDTNLVSLTGTIFWSKLDDRQTFSTLRLGLKLENGSSVFISISNPSSKAYDITKAGNKVLMTEGWMDTWEKQDNISEVVIRCYDTFVQFFPKDKALSDINEVSITGKIVSYSEDTAVIEMVGDKNPKTQQYTVRKASVKIGDSYSNIINSKINLKGKLISVDLDGKSKLVVEALYDKIIIF